jgi:2-amino-4-hydroxy-6-hydroxymethyldihydropteridine diphosphokinase
LHLPSETPLYAIALGSNRRHGRFGAPRNVIAAAVAELERRFDLFDVSPTVLNPAVGGAGRDFANAVALVASPLVPPEMLRELKAIEQDFGRRSGRRWGARVLDLDIIAWSGGRWRGPGLIIPHPRLAQRDFVLGPLGMIAPNWRLAGSLTVRHLAHRLARTAPRR